MINRVVLVGRLTKDPELRTTPSGAKVCQYTLAVNRNRKAEGQPDADFINCVTWNRQAETMAQYLDKGSLIGIEGRIQTRNYDNQNGQKVYVTEIITDSVQFLESKSNSSQNRLNESSVHHGDYQVHESPFSNDSIESEPLIINSDDLPF